MNDYVSEPVLDPVNEQSVHRQVSIHALGMMDRPVAGYEPYVDKVSGTDRVKHRIHVELQRLEWRHQAEATNIGAERSTPTYVQSASSAARSASVGT